MNEYILNINKFKEDIANIINKSKLPADVMKYVLQEYVGALSSLAMQQLYNAQKEEEGVKDD